MELISHKTALLAKEKGFDDKVLNGFTKDAGTFSCGLNSGWGETEVKRPYQPELQSWLDKTFQVRVEINTSRITGKYDVQLKVKTDINSQAYTDGYIWETVTLLGKSGFTHEEALENGLKEALLRLS